MEKVLVLNGSFCELPIIEECHRQGFYVITTGNMPELMAHQYADEYVCADYSDCRAILQIVKKKGISHILTNANDFGSITAAYVDEQMGWHHHDTYQHALMLHHKDLFKEYIQKKGFPTPFSRIFTNQNDAEIFVKNEAQYPVIVKANDLTGGKGILKANNQQEALHAINNAFNRSRSKHVLIEPFVTGNQQTFVSFLHNQKVIATSSCDSYSWVNPYLIQAETLPANHIEQVEEELISMIEEMTSELNLADGIFAFQYIRNDEGVQIIEMMRRPFGNQFLQLVEQNSGFPWHRAQVVAETGGDWGFLSTVPTNRQEQYCGHFGVMAKKSGVLRGWQIPQSIQRHITKQFVMKQIGDRIDDHLNERVAFLHFMYDSYEEMCSSLQIFRNQIIVDVE